jgi:hypothetical protein
MADTPYTLRVEREDGELVVIEGLEVVQGFLARDLSAKPGGFNDLAGTGDRARISVDDVRTVNKTMRSRSKYAYWQPVFDDAQTWLEEIPDDLDIIEANDDEWNAANGSALVSKAIESCIRPHIALARSTKVLHLKRPYMFPVLDELIVEMMGVSLPTKPDQRAVVAKRVTAAIRREGRRNIDALRNIQAELATSDIKLSLVRIFDIALWFSHPAASVAGAEREIRISMRQG